MDLHDLIISAADRFSVPRPLVLAVCEQESSCDPWAWNPEPRYRYLWDILLEKPFRKLTPAEEASEIPPLDFFSFKGVPADAEWWGQQASWGLCQVMGAVAREHGFLGRFLSQLCDPPVGLEYGCRHLSGYLKRFGDPFPALEAFNGGPGAVGKNAKYAGKVLARAEHFNV
jgi:soluble lytic murein transglycosylase-like protein